MPTTKIWLSQGEYSDEGKSGKSVEGRPQFQQMLADIESGKDNVDFVLKRWRGPWSDEGNRRFLQLTDFSSSHGYAWEESHHAASAPSKRLWILRCDSDTWSYAKACVRKALSIVLRIWKLLLDWKCSPPPVAVEFLICRITIYIVWCLTNWMENALLEVICFSEIQRWLQKKNLIIWLVLS